MTVPRGPVIRGRAPGLWEVDRDVGRGTGAVLESRLDEPSKRKNTLNKDEPEIMVAEQG